MKNRLQFKDKSGSIPIVMLVAIAGFLATYLLLSSNYRHPEKDQSIQYIKYTNEYKVQEVNKDTLAIIQNDTLIKQTTVDRKEMLFNLNPNLLVWTCLILIMMTIASASFLVFIWQIMQLNALHFLKSTYIWRAFFYALGIILFLFISQLSTRGFFVPSQIIEKFGILFLNGWVINVIVAAALFLQIPLLMVIFLVGITADKVVFNIKEKESIEKAIFQFSNLNQVLNGALQVLAVLVVFSVLTTSALGQSIKSALVIHQFDIFPKEISYVYGLYFSLFLGIIYIPHYLYLKNCFKKLKQGIQTGLESESEEDQKWSENILNKINLGGSALDNLKLALTVLAPLISGFLPEQFKLFG